MSMKLRFILRAEPSITDSKTTVVNMHAMQFLDNDFVTYEFPDQFKSLTHHDRLMELPTAKMAKRDTTKRWTKKPFMITLPPELAKLYVDEEGNAVFMGRMLDELDNSSLLTDSSRSTQPPQNPVERQPPAPKPITTVVKDAVVPKFGSKIASSNPEAWIAIFERECQRLEIDPGRYWEVLRLFLEDAAEKWFITTRLSSESTAWEFWRSSFIDNFSHKGIAIARTAFSYRYIGGPMTDYIQNKLNLLITFNPHMHELDRIAHLILGLPPHLQERVNLAEIPNINETNGANIPRNISTRHKAEEVPEFRGPIGNVTTPLGKEALLACTVDHMNIARYKVGWLKKEDQTVLTMHDKVITQSLRINVLHDNSSNTWQLRIKHVKEADRGCYVCQINTSIMKSQFGCIDVHVPPDFLYQETSTDFAVREGENVSLVCKATGHPPPRITWRRAAEDGEDILFREGREFKKVEIHRGTTLKFSAVSREQMGAYLCIASNDVPPAVSKRITLSVNFPPSIHVPNQLLGAPLNTEVKMECVVQAYPNAVNYWNKNGTIIFEGSKYRLTEKRDKIYRVISVLRIQNFSKGDEGAYKCESTNSVGSAEGAIRVYELNEGSQTHSQTSSRGDGSHHSRDGRNCVSLTRPIAFVTICLLLSNLLRYEMR